jgi:geranylgeranyl diphosphate synthase type I
LVAVNVDPSVPAVVDSAEAFLLSVDRELREFLERQRDRMAELAPESAMLVEELIRTLTAGGKRLRPIFCYWGYRAGGGLDPAIARAGAALELLHTFALIQDDVLDRSSLRRGQATSFRHLAATPLDSTSMDPAAREGPGEGFGRSAAILAGDLAQIFADELLADSGFPPGRILAAYRHFNDMRIQAVAGELLDLVLARRGHADEAGARRAASLKSSSYSVVGPLMLGAALAGAGPDLLEALTTYGWPLGEAFQLRDDVLGAFGDPAVTGKDRDTDLRQGKQTTLVAKARSLADEDSAAVLAAGIGRAALRPEQAEAVREVIRTSGALAETMALAGALGAQAVLAIRLAPIPEDVRTALAGLAELVVVRDT